MVIAYISGRKWGFQIYNYYRPRLVAYIRRKYRPVVGASLQSVEIDEAINAKKKFDLESVITEPQWSYNIIHFVLMKVYFQS